MIEMGAEVDTRWADTHDVMCVELAGLGQFPVEMESTLPLPGKCLQSLRNIRLRSGPSHVTLSDLSDSPSRIGGFWRSGLSS